MADKILNIKLKQATKTAAQWASQNPILLNGEVGHESDSTKTKTGNGSATWNSLPYDKADKADKLTTARTLSLTGDVTGSGSFDGSTNLSITATVTDNSHNHTKANITDFPTLATVATSGSYNDLSSKPTIPTAYSLPTTSASVLGGIKVGTNLSIDGNGVLSATNTNTTYTAGNGLNLSGTQFAIKTPAVVASGVTGDFYILASASNTLNNADALIKLPISCNASGALSCNSINVTTVYTGGVNISTLYAPISHTHGGITNDGKIGTTANLPIITGTGGILQAGSFGTAAGTFCQGNDSRLSNARTPTAHTHGDISNTGAITSTVVTPASGDCLILSDSSASNVLKRGITLGSSTTTFLRNDGAWADIPSGGSSYGACFRSWSTEVQSSKELTFSGINTARCRFDMKISVNIMSWSGTIGFNGTISATGFINYDSISNSDFITGVASTDSHSHYRTVIENGFIKIFMGSTSNYCRLRIQPNGVSGTNPTKITFTVGDMDGDSLDVGSLHGGSVVLTPITEMFA